MPAGLLDGLALTASLLPTSAAGSTPSPTPSLTQSVQQEAAIRCADGSLICSTVRGWTGSKAMGQFAEAFVGTPLRVIAILLVGLLLRWVLHRVIDRVSERIATGGATVGSADARSSTAAAVLSNTGLLSARRSQRARTLASVLKSGSTALIGAVVGLMALGDLGFNVAPLIASAGIVGVAIGFGAQALVKDMLSGIFMLVEDQYGVGDVVDLGSATGTVEAVALRVTRLRDVEGAVWYVRNGEILRVGNKSQGWARAVVDVDVAYGADLALTKAVLLRTAQALGREPDFEAKLVEEPEVWGVEALAADGVTVRLVVKTAPLQQWAVARALRERIKSALDEAGVEIPFPQRTVWLRNAAEGQDPDAKDPAGQDRARS